jgi:hypothetical protein
MDFIAGQRTALHARPRHTFDLVPMQRDDQIRLRGQSVAGFVPGDAPDHFQLYDPLPNNTRIVSSNSMIAASSFKYW